MKENTHSLRISLLFAAPPTLCGSHSPLSLVSFVMFIPFVLSLSYVYA
jgi:hypothetical protein